MIYKNFLQVEKKNSVLSLFFVFLILKIKETFLKLTYVDIVCLLSDGENCNFIITVYTRV